MDKEQLLNLLKNQGFSDEILKAFEKIQRENFVSENLKKYAYENEPLPIGENATISQPYTIAFMLELLELDKLNQIKTKTKILEIGSGSGYVLALINEIIKNSEIFGIEIIKELVERSRKVLKNNKNIKIIHRSGSKGLTEEAPFDRILVSATADKIPNLLINQLKINGILVIPIKNSIFKIAKKDSGIIKKEYPGFIFVPLIDDSA